MKPQYDFDTTPFFRTAAVDLLIVHGHEALTHADKAIEKMAALGDEEGLFLWRGIQSALWAETELSTLPVSRTRH